MSKFEEEAIEEEMLEAIMNLSAGEEHLLETVLREVGKYLETKNESIKESIIKHLEEMDGLRKMRKKLVGKILELRGIKSDEEEKGMRSGKGELWCLTKHALLIKMHLFETCQKYMNLAGKDNENKGKWIQNAVEMISLAREVHLILVDTIDTIFPRLDKNQKKIDEFREEEKTKY